MGFLDLDLFCKIKSFALIHGQVGGCAGNGLVAEKMLTGAFLRWLGVLELVRIYCIVGIRSMRKGK